MTTKKVAHYFSDHSVTVVSDAPLSKILNNRDATGRVAKWAIELLPLDIKFEAKKAIKSQAIADFVVEWIEQQQPELARVHTQEHRQTHMRDDELDGAVGEQHDNITSYQQ